jgi:hypothetical protein
MPDYRILEAKQKATKAITTHINYSTKPLKGSDLRLMIADNYGLSGRWVDEYVRDLADSGIVKAEFSGKRLVSVWTDNNE